MHIFGLMTRHAVAAKGCSILVFGGLLLVTLDTTDLAVRAIEHIFGSLVMIEVPQDPRPCVVTTLTTLTQGEFVFVFFFVA